MNILLFGLSHDQASVALREKVAFSSVEIPEVLALLLDSGDLSEVALLSTCNRTEIYAVASDAAKARDLLVTFIAGRQGVESQLVAEAFQLLEDESAVEHLLRVASGLESQILGEGQILGQVRDCADRARNAGAMGPVLDSLFRHAIACGKRARSDTAISQGAVSVGAAAVELARDALGTLAGRSVLLIGTGKIGELTLKHLSSQGVSRILVANRTLESAAALAKVTGSEAVPFSGVQSALGEIDVVLCCTGAPHYILTKGDLESVISLRASRPLVLVDVSVPRNIDPDIAEFPGVQLFDMDGLASVAERNRAERSQLVSAVEGVISDDLSKFAAWVRSYHAAPTITGLRQKLDQLRLAELERFSARYGSVFSEQQLAAIEELTRQIANKFLHEPTVGLKAQVGAKRDAHALAIQELFGIGTTTMHRLSIKRGR